MDSETCQRSRHVARDAKWAWWESERVELHVILRFLASVRAAWRYPFLRQSIKWKEGVCWGKESIQSCICVGRECGPVSSGLRCLGLRMLSGPETGRRHRRGGWESKPCTRTHAE